MLSPSDAAVVRRDPALPDLGLLLDPDRLRVALERTVGRQLPRPVVTYLRYKAGRSCLASCRIEVDGESLAFSAKHHRPDADKLRQVMMRPAVPSPLGPGRFVLVDTTVVVSIFPNDGKLRRLGWLASPDDVSAMACQIDGIGEDDSAATARIDTLHYNPERRFVGRLSINGRSRATVRCYRREDYSIAADKAGCLHSRDALKLARPLVRDSRRSVVVMEWLEGRPLEDAIARRPGTNVQTVGAALAQLHQQEVLSLPLRTEGAEAAVMLAVARDLGDTCPEFEVAGRRLATQLAARLASHRDELRPIHGDFYARQVLLDDDAAAVLDLDEAALGDPAIDLGRFRADLESAVIRGRLVPDAVDTIIESVLQGYQLASGGRPERVDLHAAAQLLRLTTHPFRRREQSWFERSAALLERSRTLLETHDRACAAKSFVPAAIFQPPPVRPFTRSLVSDSFNAADDPSMPFLAAALDPAQMAVWFDESLRGVESTDGVDVRGIEVTRHKPGRRCLIEYDVALLRAGRTPNDVGLIGKVRAKGPDRTAHQLLYSLWTGEFGSHTADGISVPEPVAMIVPLHMTLQRKVPGAPVERQLDGPKGREVACRVAETIDKLHRLSPPTLRRHSIHDEIRILHERLTRVARETPAWQDRLDTLMERCQQMAATVESGPACGIHRDFHPNQLLVDGERLYLLDLDLYSEGDPALDVGNFVAHIDEYSLRRFGDPDRLADRKDVLIDRYLSLSGRTTRGAIEGYAVLALARLVAISRHFPDRRAHTEHLLALCEQRVLGSHSSYAASRCP